MKINFKLKKTFFSKLKKLKNLPFLKYIYFYIIGGKILNDSEFIKQEKNYLIEKEKEITRTEIINFIISKKNNQTKYLEIGVRNRKDNFNLINSKYKYSVDPAVNLIEENHFQITSDTFFNNLKKGDLLDPEIKFDLIFIDGLHLAEQVDRDIENSLKYIKDDGYILLHDCNPPSEWHARENYSFSYSPALGSWNGTVWKAFYKKRLNKNIYSCCIDTDWGIGVISKTINLGPTAELSNHFFEFKKFEENRYENLNLISFEDFKKLL